MSELRRIDVLLNKESGERYNEGDLVKITEVGTYKREFVGRIRYIETLTVTIDTSKEYESNTKKIHFDDIRKIEKLS